MATTNTLLLDAATRHAVYVNRYSGSQIKELSIYLERIRRIVSSRLANTNITRFNRNRLNIFLKNLDLELEKIYSQMSDRLKKNMEEFGEYEADFSKRMFDNSSKATFNVPSSIQIQAAVFGNPVNLIDDDTNIDKALRKFSRSKRTQIGRIIRDGAILGDTNDQIISSIRNNVSNLQRHQAASLVQTIVNHVSTAARQSVYEANSNLIEAIEWISTLDTHTTTTCISLDREIFEIGKGPRPPAHWGCRSTTKPKIKKQYSLIEDVPAARPSATGPVNTRSNYGSWLRNQPKSFQDDALGPVRSKLFREGGLSVDKFVDSNYKPLTIKQLMKKEPLTFERVGL